MTTDKSPRIARSRSALSSDFSLPHLWFGRRDGDGGPFSLLPRNERSLIARSGDDAGPFSLTPRNERSLSPRSKSALSSDFSLPHVWFGRRDGDAGPFSLPPRSLRLPPPPPLLLRMSIVGPKRWSYGTVVAFVYCPGPSCGPKHVKACSSGCRAR